MNRSQPTTSPRTRRPLGPSRATGGFTLIEVMVAVGIIALLLGLLTSAVIKGRAVAEQGATKQFMNSIALAVKNYARDVGEVPPYPTGVDDDNNPKDAERAKGLHDAIAQSFRHNGRPYPAYITAGGRQVDGSDEDLYLVDQWEHVIDYRVLPDDLDDLDEDDFPEDYLQDNRTSLNAAPFLLHSPGPNGTFGDDDDILVIGE